MQRRRAKRTAYGAPAKDAGRLSFGMVAGSGEGRLLLTTTAMMILLAMAMATAMAMAMARLVMALVAQPLDLATARPPQMRQR